MILSGIFLYSITHNGIRNTLMWMTLAILFLVTQEKEHVTQEEKQTDYLDRGAGNEGTFGG